MAGGFDTAALVEYRDTCTALPKDIGTMCVWCSAGERCIETRRLLNHRQILEMTNFTPIHFFDESIEVLFDTAPTYEKTPPCPNGFVWNDESYRIIQTLSEWSDFTRRGKYARNMRPAHAAVASTRGSLNVGRFYFRVRAVMSSNKTAGQVDDQIFDLYYDRAMKNVDERKGQWFLYRELAEK